MFGRHPQSGNGHNVPPRPAASEIAQIIGGGLVQVVVTNVTPLSYYLFLNEREVSQIDIDSLSIYIEAPDDTGVGGTVRATLARYAPNVTGEKSLQHAELFPCTLELVALGRRLMITCVNADSFEGLWVSLGLKPDGTGSELTGLKSLTVLINENILHASLTWVDGETEDLLPQ